MTEEFLQFIWKNSLYLTSDLKTIQGQKVKVVNPGKLNTDAGPDFFNASILEPPSTGGGQCCLEKAHPEVAPGAVASILGKAPLGAAVQIREEALCENVVLGGLEGHYPTYRTSRPNGRFGQQPDKGKASGIACFRYYRRQNIRRTLL